MKKLDENEKKVRRIVRAIVKKFRTFGKGARNIHDNPLARAMKNELPVFALGVDVEDVVRFILSRK